MSQEFQFIRVRAARVRFIDGGARKFDADDCDNDHLQCVCFFFFELRLEARSSNG